MVKIWRNLQASLGPPFSAIINEGIDKLNAYHHRTGLVPAYTISMSTLHMFAIMISRLHSKYLVLNPSMKLQHIPLKKHGEAKSLLRRVLVVTKSDVAYIMITKFNVQH